jgi:hypothetical protein
METTFKTKKPESVASRIGVNDLRRKGVQASKASVA